MKLNKKFFLLLVIASLLAGLIQMKILDPNSNLNQKEKSEEAKDKIQEQSKTKKSRLNESFQKIKETEEESSKQRERQENENHSFGFRHSGFAPPKGMGPKGPDRGPTQSGPKKPAVTIKESSIDTSVCSSQPQLSYNMYGFVCKKYKESFVPFRRNSNGEIEIFSHDGRNASGEKATEDECKEYVKSHFRQVKPLECGEKHKKVWGSTGYDDENHWCNFANKLPELKINIFKWHCVTSANKVVRIGYDGNLQCLLTDNYLCATNVRTEESCKEAIKKYGDSTDNNKFITESCSLFNVNFVSSRIRSLISWCHYAYKAVSKDGCCSKFNTLPSNQVLKPTANWKCMKFEHKETAVRINAKGALECFSIDGKDCAWNKPDCWGFVKSNAKNLKPIECNPNQMRLKDEFGRSNIRHWCYISKNYFNVSNQMYCK